MGASGSHSDKTTYYRLYSDNDGLSYCLFDKIVRGNVLDPDETDDSVKGDLWSIKYEVSKKLQKQTWIEK